MSSKGSRRNRESVTRTFRIDADYDRILEEEADRQGLSPSALHNQIMRMYSDFWRFLLRSSSLTFDRRVILALLTEMSEESLAKAGEVLGAMLPRDWLLMRGLPLTFEPVARYIEETLGKYRRLFDCDRTETRDRTIFHLRHDLGRKWSVFLDGYLTSMFKSMLSLNVTADPQEEALTIYVDKRDIESKQE